MRRESIDQQTPPEPAGTRSAPFWRSLRGSRASTWLVAVTLLILLSAPYQIDLRAMAISVAGWLGRFATAHIPGASLIALGNWGAEETDVSLVIDWLALGLDEKKTRLRAPAIEDFQEELELQPGETLRIEPRRGRLLVTS